MSQMGPRVDGKDSLLSHAGLKNHVLRDAKLDEFGTREPSEEELRELYVDEGLGRRRIADKFDTTPVKIKNLIRDHGIIRPDNVEWSREKLKKLYIDDGLTQHELVEELDSYTSKVRRHLAHHGVSKSRSQATQDGQTGGSNGPSTPAARHFVEQQGYVRFSLPNTTIDEHRIVAIGEFGLDAVCGCQVHHINGIGWDNRPSNLELKTQEQHLKEHWHATPLGARLSKADDEEVIHALENAGYFEAAEKVIDNNDTRRCSR